MSSSLETMPQFAEHVIPDEAAEADEIRNPVKVTNCDTAPRGEKKVFAELGA